MNNGLSEKWAKINVNLIAIFYLISGYFEFLLMMRGETKSYFLLNIYHSYVGIIGAVTFIIGITLFFKNRTSRLAALAIAYWNIFTAPLLEIWWITYKIYIKGWSSRPLSPLLMWLETGILILIITFIRIYIIYMLRISKAGWIFLKDKQIEKPF